jgi:hypothetical protein
MTTVDATVSAIDAAIREGTTNRECWQCGDLLTTSPSDDFCTEYCQTEWLHHHRATTDPVDNGAQPDPAVLDTDPEQPMTFLPPPPGGAAVLDEVTAFVSRFSALPDEHCAPMLALWYAHTHAAAHFYVTPRLILDSAEPGSGKTRVLEVAQFLVAAPEMTISATPAALFRMVSEGPITILFDEVDAIFNAKTGGNNEDLRALLNAGYKRTATVARCVGDAKAMKVAKFPVYAPAALAGIAGGMPSTITTRAITVHMRRRALDEHVDEFWEEDVEQQSEPLRTKLAVWIGSVGERIGRARPTMPEGVRDRSAEIWRPLLAIADEAGEQWPDRARAACSHFVTSAGADTGGNLRAQLLADIRDLFTAAHVDKLPTTDILTGLLALDEGPWQDFHGKPLNALKLSKELRPYGVKSRDVRMPGATGAVKGYAIDGIGGLADAWRRYLPDPGGSRDTRDTRDIAGQRVADVADVAGAPATDPPGFD